MGVVVSRFGRARQPKAMTLVRSALRAVRYARTSMTVGYGAVQATLIVYEPAV